MSTSNYSKKLNVQEIAIDKLKQAKYNPRIMRDEEFDGLVESIKAFGQRENLIVNSDMTLISGHMRLMAMSSLGFKTVMCDVVELSKDDEKKLNLIMNNPHIQGKFDRLKVDALLAELTLTGTELEGFRLPQLGTLDLSPDEGEEPKKKQIACHNCPIHCAPILAAEGVDNSK